MAFVASQKYTEDIRSPASTFWQLAECHDLQWFPCGGLCLPLEIPAQKQPSENKAREATSWVLIKYK